MNTRKLKRLAYLLLLILLMSCKKDEPTAVSNSAPNPPSHPIPADSAIEQSVAVNLAWTGSDPDGDSLTYDVHLGTTITPPLLSLGQSGTSFNPDTLVYDTTYYWRIVALDNHDHSTSGPTWSFRTKIRNDAPNLPSNPIPVDSAIEQSVTVNLAWICSDREGDTLTYDVYFGTTNPPPLVSSTQLDTTYDPGMLDDNTTYYWQVIAYDNHNHSVTGPMWHFSTIVDITAGMVLVPAGSYGMGSDVVGGHSVPEHTVNVPAFYMDIYEVTNAQYRAFCDATHRPYLWDFDSSFFYPPPYFTNPAFANYPLIVNWNDAHAYAEWAGKRLPSEAEWEYAAKGSQDNRLWPWGDTWNDSYANSSGADRYMYTSPVGAYPQGISPMGCYDMAGNVQEWCEDTWHQGYLGAPTDGSAWVANPPFDEDHVIRGGGWAFSSPNLRCAKRDPMLRTYRGSGFRCAWTP